MCCCCELANVASREKHRSPPVETMEAGGEALSSPHHVVTRLRLWWSCFPRNMAGWLMMMVGPPSYARPGVTGVGDKKKKKKKEKMPRQD